MTILTTRGLAPVREVLTNGTAVTVKESRTTPAVTISAAVKAGSAFDPPGTVGLAHFLSRVIDRGTVRRSADDIADELDSRGVALTVTVTRHLMTLALTCLAEDFEAMLDLVADLVRHATCPAGEVAKRRTEIVTAIRQDQDSPAVQSVERVLAQLYGATHPYGRLTKGTIDEVARIASAALCEFHAARFVPAHLSLVVVGDVPPDQVLASAARTFGDWPNRAGSADALPLPPPIIARRRSVLPMMNKVQADVAYAFVTITRADPAYYAYWLMNNILGQYSLGGRLGDSIRERQGMAYYVYSAFDANVVPGPLLIRAGVSPANVERAVASIDEEVARMAADGPTEAEVADSKRYLIGSLPRMLETNAGIANFLQTAEFFGLGLDYDLRLPDLLGAVTRDEVHAAARRSLAPDRATIVIAGPYADTQGDPATDNAVIG